MLVKNGSANIKVAANESFSFHLGFIPGIVQQGAVVVMGLVPDAEKVKGKVMIAEIGFDMPDVSTGPDVGLQVYFKLVFCSDCRNEIDGRIPRSTVGILVVCIKRVEHGYPDLQSFFLGVT
jgi:hypothetical protein